MTQSSPTTSDILTDAFAPVEVLPVQAGDYAYLAWLNQEQLVVQYQPTALRDAYSSRIGVLTRTSTSVELLDLPPHPACKDRFYALVLPAPTPSGHLAYSCRCSQTKIGMDYDHPMLYNPETNTAVPVRPQPFDPLNPQHDPTGVDKYSFFPDMQTGLLVDGWTGQNQLHIFDATSVTKVDLGVTVVPNAVLAPNGQQVALTTQQGSPGIYQLEQPHTLSLANPLVWDRQELFTGYFLHGISWSPDSRFFSIVVSEQVKSTPEIWIVNAETHTRRRIAEGRYGQTAWSPDGNMLAATRHLTPYENEIILLDLTAIELP